ncbi:MAG: response regulator transcription factor [Prevotella sp.]|nr:response regulator transcription factor [Prevotella sp.]
MKTLTCMVVDDEPLAVKLLESFVNKTPDLQLVASFTDSVEAISAIKSRPVDLLFLDIQMPDMNGMELAHIVPPETKIIFATAFKEYAYESYEVSALDFLLKPIRYNKFLAAVEKARQWYDRMEAVPEKNTPRQDDTIFIKVDGALRQISIASIMYVSGMKDYVMFWIIGERKALITHMTMKAVEDMLPAAQFMRVHRSYIVALNKIRSIDRNDCIYIGEEIIHVTEAYRPQFQQFLSSRISG